MDNINLKKIIKIVSLADILALPFFILLLYYLSIKSNKSPLVYLLILFALGAIIVDSISGGHWLYTNYINPKSKVKGITIHKMTYIGDIVAIPLFAILLYYLIFTKNKGFMEYILIFFAVVGFIVDSYVTSQRFRK